MPLTTANTILKYGIKQQETATVAGNITGSGNLSVIVTGAGITGSPITKNVAVLNGDVPNVSAQKIRDALLGDANITALYDVSGADNFVILTRKVASANDATLNIALSTGTATGLTSAPTSANTVAGVDFAKLSDITNYPDMGSTPSKIDNTTLTNQKYKTNQFGLSEAPDLTFEANYDETIYQTIVGLTSIYSFQLEFGTSDGKFNWDGQVSCYVNSAGVDELRKMSIIVSTVTPIVPSAT